MKSCCRRRDSRFIFNYINKRSTRVIFNPRIKSFPLSLSLCRVTYSCIYARKPTSNHGKRKYILGGELNSIVAEYRRSTLSRIKYASYKFDATSELDIPAQEGLGKVTVNKLPLTRLERFQICQIFEIHLKNV